MAGVSSAEWGLILAVAAIALWKIFDAFGWLPRGTVTRAAQERADNAEWELKRKAEELEKAQRDLHQKDLRIAELEGQTNLSPLISHMETLADLQGKSLEKLAKMNGSLDRTQRGLEKSVEGLTITNESIRFLASQIVQLMADKPAP